MFINYPPVALKYIYIYKYKSIHYFAYQATSCIPIGYQLHKQLTYFTTRILLYYQNLKCTFMIILLLVKINKIILGFALYQTTTLQRFVADIATRHYCTSQLTPQAKKITPQSDQEPGQYRSGHDWYSSSSGLNMNIGC